MRTNTIFQKIWESDVPYPPPAEKAEGGGVSMLFCEVGCFRFVIKWISDHIKSLVQLMYYVGQAKYFIDRLGHSGHRYAKGKRNTIYAEHRALHKYYKAHWTKIGHW
jgi:hypothetical protein